MNPIVNPADKLNNPDGDNNNKQTDRQVSNGGNWRQANPGNPDSRRLTEGTEQTADWATQPNPGGRQTAADEPRRTLNPGVVPSE